MQRHGHPPSCVLQDQIHCLALSSTSTSFVVYTLSCAACVEAGFAGVCGILHNHSWQLGWVGVTGGLLYVRGQGTVVCL
jgi:hypothetical protein